MIQVLSLDGGGAKGLIQAVLLEKIENALNAGSSEPRPIGAFFDLTVGTSIGGIVALAIAKGMFASEIRKTLSEKLEQIFPSRRFHGLRGWFGSKYRRAPLKVVLEELFSAATLGELGRNGFSHVCVVAHNPVSKRARLFKSTWHVGLAPLANMKLVDIALATSAAPTYFDPYLVCMSDTNVNSHLLDGGLVANNPSLVASIEGAKLADLNFAAGADWHASRDLSEGKVNLLSIGTGRVPQLATRMVSAPPTGKLGWASQLHGHVLAAQSDFAEYTTRSLLPRSRYLRVNPELGAECELDSATNVLGMVNAIYLRSDEERSIVKRFSKEFK
jgi:uncharacterized protein